MVMLGRGNTGWRQLPGSSFDNFAKQVCNATHVQMNQQLLAAPPSTVSTAASPRTFGREPHGCHVGALPNLADTIATDRQGLHGGQRDVRAVNEQELCLAHSQGC